MAACAFEEIAEDFEFLDSWEDRYLHVIDLGKSMHPLEDELKVPSTKVDGCASQVWIVPEIADASPEPKFRFRGDSDAMIVRGLIAILSSLYNDVPLSQVRKIDAKKQLSRLELHEHLTPQRSNGLNAMVVAIQRLAEIAHSARCQT